MPRISQKTNVVRMPVAAVRRPASEVTPEAIAVRAYEIYLSRGGSHGHSIDDWLQAERELQVSGGKRRVAIDRRGAASQSLQPARPSGSAPRRTPAS